MKKVIAILLAVVMMLGVAASLTACGEPTPKQTEKPADPTLDPNADVLVLKADNAGGWELRLKGGLTFQIILTEYNNMEMDKGTWTFENGVLTLVTGAEGTLTSTTADGKLSLNYPPDRLFYIADAEWKPVLDGKTFK